MAKQVNNTLLQAWKLSGFSILSLLFLSSLFSSLIFLVFFSLFIFLPVISTLASVFFLVMIINWISVRSLKAAEVLRFEGTPKDLGEGQAAMESFDCIEFDWLEVPATGDSEEEEEGMHMINFEKCDEGSSDHLLRAYDSNEELSSECVLGDPIQGAELMIHACLGTEDRIDLWSRNEMEKIPRRSRPPSSSACKARGHDGDLSSFLLPDPSLHPPKAMMRPLR